MRAAAPARFHLLLFAGLFAAWPAVAQHLTGADIFGGEQAFQNVCANCHGSAGNQIAGVDLGHGVFRKPYDDEQLTSIVMNGIPGTAMPATPSLTREQALRIVGYLRSRAATKDAGAGGDPARGRALFEGEGACLDCHRIDGRGSPRGPELSRIGRLRTSEQLAASLLDPQAEIQATARSYGVTTRDGRQLSGRLLNRDSYSVQMLSEDGRLLSVERAGLRSEGFLPSPMPSLRDRFDPQAIADLVRYLGSLRGPEGT